MSSGGTRSPSDERGKLQSPELVRMQTMQNQKDHKVKGKLENMKIRSLKKKNNSSPDAIKASSGINEKNQIIVEDLEQTPASKKTL